MEQIWAPWRMEYIGASKDSDKACCFLCLAPEEDEKAMVLERREKAFAIMNKYPYANGHVMVVPIRHVGRIEELTDAELMEMMGLVRMLSSVMTSTLNAEGINIGINMGKAAGAGLEEHIHIHMVPRWFGDTNFMPVIGDTKVISEHLAATYRKLKERIER